MLKQIKILGSIFFLLAIFIPSVHARNNANIMHYHVDENGVSTRVVYSVRSDAYIEAFLENGLSANYQPQTTGSANLNAITYGNNTYVAVGDSSTIWYLKTNENQSIDTEVWKLANVSGGASFKAVEFGNGRFVAVATEGTIYYSDDGVNWQYATGNDVGEYDPNLYSVMYANGVFIAVGNDYYHGAPAIFSSPDGKTWHVNQIGNADSREGVLYSIAYGGNNTFVAVGGREYAYIYVSNDNGNTWRDVSVDATATFYSVTYSNGKFIAVGTGGSVYYSTDGSTWTMASGINESSLIFYDVTFGNGVFVAVGDRKLDAGTEPIWYSKDGIRWQPANGIQIDPCYGNDLPYFESVYFDGTYFITTVRDASIYMPEYYSTDGITWLSNQNPKNASHC